MHRDLKALLHDAKGTSEFVVAINLDVRGFSSFAKLAESSEAAIFLKRVYTRLLDDYFPNAAFFKPTGDGLMIALTYEDDTLRQVVGDAVETCLRVVKDFKTFCKNDPMINFDVPEQIGIGLSRGAATRLVSGDKTLDFSGRPLNLASRLMDLARPAGVVFDKSFAEGLLPKELQARFTLARVYIRGLAEKEPLGIYFSKTHVKLENASKQPIDKGQWREDTIEMTMARLRDTHVEYVYSFKSIPADPASISVLLIFPRATKSGSKGALRHEAWGGVLLMAT